MIRTYDTPAAQLAALVNGTIRDANTITVGEHEIRVGVNGTVRLGNRVLGVVADGPLALARAFDEAVAS